MITNFVKGAGILATFSTALLAVTPAAVVAQDGQNEPLFRQLVERFQTPYLSLGVLLQTVADFQAERTLAGKNGFSVANFRLRLSGELDHGVSYLLQTNFAQSPAILDARLRYRPSPYVVLDVGQFKSPFSHEFLTPASSIDFVNRSTVVSQLAPGRNLGAQVRFTDSARTIGLDLGVFNGNGIAPAGNDNNDFLYTARVAGTPVDEVIEGRRRRTVRVGANVAVSNDAPDGPCITFCGTRVLLGADARLALDRVLVAGEFLYGDIPGPPGILDPDPTGWHLTGGYLVSPMVQLLGRWDSFDADLNQGRRDVLVGGLNWWPTTVTEIRLNYLVDLGDAAPDRNQLLVNFQFGF